MSDFIPIALVITTVAAWFTHVVTAIQSEQWVFLLAGALFFPVGIIHGIGVWFGFF